MVTDHLLGILQWRDHAGDLDGAQSRASLKMLLYGCERWLEINLDATDTDDGRRLSVIKMEIEDWLECDERGPAYDLAPPPEFLRPKNEGFTES
jgi:hypothetical protein